MAFGSDVYPAALCIALYPHLNRGISLTHLMDWVIYFVEQSCLFNTDTGNDSGPLAFVKCARQFFGYWIRLSSD